MVSVVEQVTFWWYGSSFFLGTVLKGWHMEVQLFASNKASSGCSNSVAPSALSDQLNSNKAKQNATKSVAGLATVRRCLWRYRSNRLRG